MTELVTLALALPSREAAQTVSDALTGVGLSTDIHPNRWPGAARPVLVKVTGSGLSGDVVDETLLPLRESTDYEVLDRQEW